MALTALFDKSFLQALNVDEAVLFDYFFYPVISPIFFVETLADLAKEPVAGRSPAQIVGSLAFKAPEIHGGPCAFHMALGLASLMGREPPTNGQIPVRGGRPIRVEGKRGVVFEKAPESEALERWQQGQFWDLERQYAEQWRTTVKSIDLKLVGQVSQRFEADPKSAKSLAEVRDLANLVLARLSAVEQLQLAIQALGIDSGYRGDIEARWHAAGNPPLVYFAPYAHHVTLIEVFFSLALAAGKISTDRPSNRCDISYLHYLPFCLMFVSSDKLHRECAPMFLRADQSFVWGPELKADLALQNKRLHEQLSAEQKEGGLIRLAPKPSDGLVRQLWEKHNPKQLVETPTEPLSKAGSEKLAEHVRRIVNSPSEAVPEGSISEEQTTSLGIKRMIHKRRGSWFQIPKDLPVADEN